MAEPSGQPLKNKWYADTLNNGNIGSNDDLFNAPVISGEYRFYITNYQTQNTSLPIQFKIQQNAYNY